MHPNRRRKKRPNYGIRTVEVMRGPNGFGFTISGQQPCILSCIVSNSPADQAGLRAGDFLISVNGISVSKITHDAVVNLIGNSVGPIKMTIAENYYSDSSDEDIDLSRAINVRKPKYTHKQRAHRNYKYENRSNVVADRLLLDNSNKKAMKIRECAINHLPHESRLNVNVYNDEASGISLNNNLNVSNSMPMDDEAGPIEFKAIVGYLGTIEMPKQLSPNSRLQTVCSCIRKLRQEKRVPSAILMTILPTCLTLKNASNHILAIYPTNRVVYVSSSTDKESRYFGLVTSAVCDTRNVENTQKHGNSWENDVEKKSNNLEDKPDVTISNSCHVFMTDPKIVDHKVHMKKAENFKITCTADVVTGNCLEFPKNALYIVSLVQNMYRLQSDGDINRGAYKCNVNDEVIANSPQPSASSNSDSGIGFRDDCGNISDRILVVEFPSHRPLPIISNNHKRPANIVASNLPLESLDLPLNNDKNYLNNVRCKNFDVKLGNVDLSNDEKHLSNINNIRACENLPLKSTSEKQEAEYFINGLSNRLTVRAMPNPRSFKVRGGSPQNVGVIDDHARNGDIDTGQIFSERPIDVPDNPTKKSSETISFHSAGDDVVDFKSSIDNVSMHSSKSIELSNLKAVFKTPSTKFLEAKKTIKRQLKMVSSCDNLVADRYEASVLNYKLSPKVYGVSKPTHSCEELNVFETEKYGFGSLQDLSSWSAENNKPTIAQSEPDVRIQRKGPNSSTDLRVSILA
ncbi:hypothetical protein Trydic_g4054 [Trypoxylus dichotomus]